MVIGKVGPAVQGMHQASKRADTACLSQETLRQIVTLFLRFKIHEDLPRRPDKERARLPHFEGNMANSEPMIACITKDPSFVEGAGSSVGNVCSWLCTALVWNEDPKKALMLVS